MIKIFSDTTCDLSPELIQKYDIGIIPLNIILGDVTKKDGIEITPEEIYEWADANKTTPKTASPEIGVVIDELQPYTALHYDIVYIGISEQMSSTCQTIRLAAEELGYDRIFVIDSMNLSTGVGLQVIRAAKMAVKGATAEEIVEEIEANRKNVRASFCIETLTYLWRGGRCNTVSALLGGALQLRPSIVVKDGAMGVGRKYRGRMMSVYRNYLADLESELAKAVPDRVFITHSGADQEIVDMVYRYLEEKHYFRHIDITRASGVISSHCGPGTLGVLFYVNE